jgi:hypothetical protein
MPDRGVRDERQSHGRFGNIECRRIRAAEGDAVKARRLLKRFEDGLSTIMDLWSTSPTEEQVVLGQRLANELLALNETGEGSDFWRSICRDLSTLATENDPRFFMRWAPVRATMVHGARPETFTDFWMLRRSPEWRSTWRPALAHTQYGHPPPFPPMMSTNAMTIEHAAHLYRFHRSTGARFYQSDCIIEFGGGYGGMCRLIHALGFRGTYIIFDLPHVLALQRYYLGLHGIGTENSNVLLCADLDAIARNLQDHGYSHVSGISTWAMSEMPMSLRHRVEAILERPSHDKILLAYQAVFEGTDNVKYFGDFADRTREAVEWKHLPVGPRSKQPSPHDNYYLFGIRNK